MIFGYKEELFKLGKDGLYQSLLALIEDIDKKYIMKANCMNEKMYLLLGFNDNVEMKEALNHKSIIELKPYLKTISNNILNELDNEDSFISECFGDYWNKNTDLVLTFEAHVYRYTNGKAIETINIDLSIMSLGKVNKSGSGDSFSFDLVDSERLNNVKQEVISSNLMECIKTAYLEYFDEASESGLTLEQAKEYHIEGIKEWLNDFVYSVEDDLKTYESLKKLKLKEQIEKYLHINNFTKSFTEAISVDYKQYKASSLDSLLKDDCEEGSILINEDSLQIRFLGELIKTISKRSYTVYEIN